MRGPQRFESRIHKGIIPACLDPPDLPQDGRRMTSCRSCERADRKTGLGVRKIHLRGRWHPVWQASLGAVSDG